MYLTTENAEQYLGKTLDCHKRMFHHYPLAVKQFPSGLYYYKDRTGTCMLVPEPKDRFNAVQFDFPRRDFRGAKQKKGAISSWQSSKI